MRKLTPLMLAAALAGCTVSRVNMLDERTMIISGRGNAFSSMAAVSHTILVRAATEGQRRGYPFFVIEGSEDASSTGAFTTPPTTTGTATGTATCTGGFCSGQATGQSTTTGGQTFMYNRPGADAVIHFLTADEGAGAKGAWSVASVLAANPQHGAPPH